MLSKADKTAVLASTVGRICIIRLFAFLLFFYTLEKKRCSTPENQFLIFPETVGIKGFLSSLIWTRPQKLWSGVADNTLRNRRKVSFLRRDCLTLTCVLTNAPKYDNLTQVSKTPKEGPV